MREHDRCKMNVIAGSYFSIIIRDIAVRIVLWAFAYSPNAYWLELRHTYAHNIVAVHVMVSRLSKTTAVTIIRIKILINGINDCGYDYDPIEWDNCSRNCYLFHQARFAQFEWRRVIANLRMQTISLLTFVRPMHYGNINEFELQSS